VEEQKAWAKMIIARVKRVSINDPPLQWLYKYLGGEYIPGIKNSGKKRAITPTIVPPPLKIESNSS
jgi:hypothetical protein